MTPSAPHTIVLSPLGEFDTTVLAKVAAEITRVFDCRVDQTRLLVDVAFAFDNNRRQYHSTRILEELAVLAPPGCLKIIALIEVDLFIPILTYVYGEAQLGGKACVLSTFRLKEGLSPMNPEEFFAQRLAKEALHELGHTFNLRHCKDPACIMHYCRNIGDVDHKSDQLCRYCRIMLEDEKKHLEKLGRS